MREGRAQAMVASGGREGGRSALMPTCVVMVQGVTICRYGRGRNRFSSLDLCSILTTRPGRNLTGRGGRLMAAVSGRSSGMVSAISTSPALLVVMRGGRTKKTAIEAVGAVYCG